jgi:serine/threonine protein kinase
MNVLLDDMYDAKIADFGESALEKTAPTQFEDDTGTAGWAAPEVITGKGSSRASDVFSYGIILWELLTWRCPSVLITVAMLKEPSIANLSGASNHTLLKFFRSGGAGINSRKPFQSTNPLQPAINSNKAKPLTIMGLNYNFFSSGNTSTTTSTSNTTDRKPQKDDSNMMFRHSDE